MLLRPQNFSRSLTFYRDQLGLRVYREYGSGGRLTGIVLFCGGGYLELTSAGPGGDDGVGAMLLWMQVPDVDAEVSRLRGLELDVGSAETKPWGLREAWLADPDGVRIVLVEVPEGHPIRTRLE